MEIKVKKMHPDAILPVYTTEGAACFDLHALADSVQQEDRCITRVRTGLSFEVPPGHVMRIYSRSGHGFNHGVRLSNCVGVIDSDYRGEVMVSLHHDYQSDLVVNRGDRVAQAVIEPIERVTFVEADELSETARGAAGFGSTGR